MGIEKQANNVIENEEKEYDHIDISQPFFFFFTMGKAMIENKGAYT